MLTIILSLLMFLGQPDNIYSFKVNDINGKSIDLTKFKGKKILIVNTASECGYTPQYAELEKLYKQYGSKLVIIGFPANNFGGQEPGTNAEIQTFCTGKYDISFPMAGKVSVKGGDMNELFKWLTTQENPDFTGDIRWNFEKFLIDENGKLIHRYRSATKPMDSAITKAL
ncbi:glutathione peroxidase [soil metagenome]